MRFVVEEGEGKSCGLSEGGGGGWGILGVGEGVVAGDGDDGEGFFRIVARDSGDFCLDMKDIRAMGAEESDEQAFAGGEVGEGNDPTAGDIWERECGGRSSEWEHG